MFFSTPGLQGTHLPEVMRHRRIDSASFEERVRRRAYDLYAQHGGQRRVTGTALDDWLQAEKETRDDDSGEYGFSM
jgi:hypothetical protein